MSRGERISNLEARALFAELDEWQRKTATPWSRVAAEAGLSDAVRHRVLGASRRLMRVNADAIRQVMQLYPDGLPHGSARVDFMTGGETSVLAEEIRAWLDRTGAPLRALAHAVNRSEGYLIRLLDSPNRIGRSTAEALRAVMAANPGSYAPPKIRSQPWLARGEARLPLTDPLAERRGEAERRRAEWIAQQAAEHQRKYGRPMGRALEEMAA
jgi:hypothetical protein